MGPAHPLSARQDSVSEANAELACFAELTLDFVGRTLLAADGRDIPLTRGEFMLLCALVRGRGRVLTRDQLLDAVAGRRAEPFDRSIDVMIGRLRRKIEPDPKAPQLILTVAGFGYKFATPVKTVETATSLVSEPRGEPPELTRPPPPERRHITALAVELLAGEGRANLPADPEESQALIDVYRHYVTCVVARHGGVIKEARGREVIAFFGYPLAQEHVVERAIHAALALVVPPPLASSDLRIPTRRGGSGFFLTVLRCVSAWRPASSSWDRPARCWEKHLVTPHDFSALAEPGQVIIAARIRRLSGSLFAYRDIEPVTMKGVADQVQAFQVLGPSAIGSRSEALYWGMLTALVGR